MVSTTTFISDTIKFVRNTLDTNLTDPITTSRTGRDRFVMTSYPQRPVKYPILTVRHVGTTDIQRMGMQSELHFMTIPIEVRIWARNEKERDELTEQTINTLRTNNFGVSSSVDSEDLHDLSFDSNVSVDEVGEEAVKSQILQISYSFVVGE